MRVDWGQVALDIMHYLTGLARPSSQGISHIFDLRRWRLNMSRWFLSQTAWYTERCSRPDREPSDTEPAR